MSFLYAFITFCAFSLGSAEAGLIKLVQVTGVDGNVTPKIQNWLTEANKAADNQIKALGLEPSLQENAVKVSVNYLGEVGGLRDEMSVLSDVTAELPNGTVIKLKNSSELQEAAAAMGHELGLALYLQDDLASEALFRRTVHAFANQLEEANRQKKHPYIDLSKNITEIKENTTRPRPALSFSKERIPAGLVYLSMILSADKKEMPFSFQELWEKARADVQHQIQNEDDAAVLEERGRPKLSPALERYLEDLRHDPKYASYFEDPTSLRKSIKSIEGRVAKLGKKLSADKLQSSSLETYRSAPLTIEEGEALREALVLSLIDIANTKEYQTSWQRSQKHGLTSLGLFALQVPLFIATNWIAAKYQLYLPYSKELAVIMATQGLIAVAGMLNYIGAPKSNPHFSEAIADRIYVRPESKLLVALFDSLKRYGFAVPDSPKERVRWLGSLLTTLGMAGKQANLEHCQALLLKPRISTKMNTRIRIAKEIPAEQKKTMLEEQASLESEEVLSQVEAEKKYFDKK